MDRLRIGALGAARILPEALLKPAAQRSDLEVTAIASRDVARAERVAARHGIRKTYASYEELLTDAEISAVYVALPAALHAKWTISALEAGKHVLCEKPFAANAAEAMRMIDAGKRAGRVVAEAFHYFYHPFAEEMRAVCARSLAGKKDVRVEAWFNAPIRNQDDIRRKFELGGGAMMDLGCYAVHWIRTILREEPAVTSSHAVSTNDVDESMTTELAFPSGATGLVRCSMEPSLHYETTIHVTAPGVDLTFINPLVPHAGSSMKLVIDGVETVRSVPGESSYACQLEAFASAIRGGAPMPTSGEDSIANMKVLDAAYLTAGLALRGDAG